LIMHHPILILVGGLTLFLFGMSIVSEHLQRLAANRVRDALSKLERRNVFSVVIGVLLTVMLQSSGAVTSMLVGLGSAKIIRLPQIMGIIIGSSVGTTLTVQLISFKIVEYGLPLFILGFSVYFVTKSRYTRSISAVLMGFGMVFWGLELMGQGSEFLKENNIFQQLLMSMKGEPLLAMVVTALMTGLVHSSAVVIGLAMTLTTSGLMDLTDSMYWVFGANIGTTSTALLASLNSNYVGRQVAWAHFAFKLGSVLLFLPIVGPFAYWVDALEPTASRDIANAHTIYNVVAAILFFPFIDLAARRFEKFIRPTSQEREFGPEFLTTSTHENPALAYARARREVMRMGDILKEMVVESAQLFDQYRPDLIDKIKTQDSQLDLLNREIKMYLVRHQGDANWWGSSAFQVISFANDLESVGDVVDGHLIDLAVKQQELKIDFSSEGHQEILDLHQEVVKVMELSLSAFHLSDPNLATQAIKMKRDISERELECRRSHVKRLQQGRAESIRTSSIHLEVLMDLKRISSLVCNHCYALAGESKKAPEA